MIRDVRTRNTNPVVVVVVVVRIHPSIHPSNNSIIKFMSNNNDNAAADDVACRTYLRERALRAWTDLRGRRVEITLAGDASPCATGTFAGVDADEECFLVERLTSALGTTERARVKCADVVSMRVLKDDDGDDKKKSGKKPADGGSS